MKNTKKILDFIEEESVDLIAMSTHARTGPSKLIFGSVAETVFRKASVPVLLLRPRENPSGANIQDETHVDRKVVG